MASDIAVELALLLAQKAHRASEPDLVQFFQVEIDNTLRAEVAKAEQVAQEEYARLRQAADNQREFLNDEIRKLQAQLNAKNNPPSDAA